MFDFSAIKPHTRIQIHALKSHAASNLNRDDLGRPKEVSFGGATRLRISSQSIKHAIRHGEIFESFRQYSASEYGTTKMIRTTLIKELIANELIKRQFTEEHAKVAAKVVAATLSKVEKPDAKGEEKEEKAGTQLLALSEKEIQIICDEMEKAPSREEKDWAKTAMDNLTALVKAKKSRTMNGDMSPEVQLFGRMVTSDSFSDVDAPLQVAHAITVHEANSERDYWTGVDDVKMERKDNGSGMIDVRRFGSGVFYQYACIDVDGVISNIRNSHASLDEAQILTLSRDLINAFIFAFVGQNPTGYQNSFASHAMPEFVALEVGGLFPHSAASIYESPIKAKDGNGYSEEATIRFGKWIETRKSKYGQDSMGQIFTVGVSQGDSNLEAAVKQASGLAVKI